LGRPDLPLTWPDRELEMTRAHREFLWRGAELEAD
jgi:hypothetical protein